MIQNKGMSDYFRLKEIDRIESEKKRMITLKKVIDVCLKKGFHFSVNPEVSNLYVSVDRFETSFSSYFKGSLIDHNDGNTMTIDKLLEKLKDEPSK